MNNILKKDKGSAGLTILLSLIVMLFIIGLIVMIFSLMGGALSTASYTSTTTAIANVSTVKAMNYSTSYVVSTARDCSASITTIKNETGTLCNSGNYTLIGCTITPKATASVGCNNTVWYVIGNYNWNADNSATNSINDTKNAVTSVTTYFPLFITIGAMVVLILLTVIIITAIRSSGLVSTDNSGTNKVGSA